MLRLWVRASYSRPCWSKIDKALIVWKFWNGASLGWGTDKITSHMARESFEKVECFKLKKHSLETSIVGLWERWMGLGFQVTKGNGQGSDSWLFSTSLSKVFIISLINLVFSGSHVPDHRWWMVGHAGKPCFLVQHNQFPFFSANIL